MGHASIGEARSMQCWHHHGASCRVIPLAQLSCAARLPHYITSGNCNLQPRDPTHWYQTPHNFHNKGSCHQAQRSSKWHNCRRYRVYLWGLRDHCDNSDYRSGRLACLVVKLHSWIQLQSRGYPNCSRCHCKTHHLVQTCANRTPSPGDFLEFAAKPDGYRLEKSQETTTL